MAINEQSGVKPSVQVASGIRDDIASGKYPKGSRIPSARELADTYGVALTTAFKAVEKLREEGLVETRRGKGSFVSARTELFRQGTRRYARTPAGHAPNMTEANAGGWRDEVKAERWREQASAAIAERLQIAPGDDVTVARYTWFVDDAPIQVGTQYEPLALVRGTAIEEPVDGTRGNPGVIARYDSIGIYVDRVEERTRARMPTPEESRILQIKSGVPVLFLTRTHYAGDTAVETADIAIRGDRMVINAIHEVPVPEGKPQ
ncbi:GntR family transcriptional regulator [Nocardia sp. NPDC127579]|uniref:GntR family transcriptional regulator n=1 Tax=Nocardia sp. NPDC127579 TaxID=3345402 RepID=UPI00362CBEBE